MRLAGKVAIVTGGSRGMGETEAKLFAAEGARVVIADVSEDDGRRVEAEIAETGGEAVFARLDVTSERDWQDVVTATVARFGKLDVLVNNAGISGGIADDVMDSDAWDRLMAVNAKGVFLGIKYAIPEMRKTGGGSIINISSISGFVGQDYVHIGYNASKGAVRILTKSAAVTNAKDGIRVNSVHPGFLPPMGTSTTTADPAIRRRMLDHVPMGREGRRGRGGLRRAVPGVRRGLLHYGNGTGCGWRISGRVGPFDCAAGVSQDRLRGGQRHLQGGKARLYSVRRNGLILKHRHTKQCGED